ncbi:MAG: hypothetical protein IKB62_01845 [Oscillospiraceae bacterium]|nr:hypothetical protein [Oscillospiraceae bacterium]
MKRLVILGFGGYGKTIEDVVLDAGLFDEIVFLDDGSTDEKVQGKCSDYVKYVSENTWFYPAFGNNALRVGWIYEWLQKGVQVAKIIHPKAYVSRNATIGEGCAVLPNATVNATARIDTGTIVNFGAVVDHDVIIRQGCHLCLNSVVKGYNDVPPLTKIEAGQVILNNSLNFKQSGEKL